jgi:hypothetical protein
MKLVCTILWRHLWPLWLHHIFPHYLINGAIFEKKLLNIKCVLRFSLQLLSKTFLILRRIRRDIAINVETYSHTVSDFNDIWIFSTDIRNESSNIKFHQNPSNYIWDIPSGRTDGYEKAKIRFPQFCERAWKLSICNYLPPQLTLRLISLNETASLKAVLRFWRLVAVLSPHKLGFNPRTVHVRCVAVKLAMEKASLPRVFFSPHQKVSFHACTILIHPSPTLYFLATDSAVKQ